MTDNLKKFLETVSKDEALTAKVSSLGKDELIDLGKELGITLTDADFAQPTGELDDDELDAVAGGGDCYCPFAGGGTKSSVSKACACTLGGGGEMRDGTTRCVCVGAGIGADCPLDKMFDNDY